jgi:hypothetical protein
VDEGAEQMNKTQILASIAALCLLGVGTYAWAQPKPGAEMGCEHDCPMHQTAALSEVKVEQTKQGAVIQMIAKRPEDVSKVQQNAHELARLLNSGSCPMMHEVMMMSMGKSTGIKRHRRQASKQPGAAGLKPRRRLFVITIL